MTATVPSQLQGEGAGGNMKYLLTETVIEYDPEDLVRWKRGAKAKYLSGTQFTDEVFEQPDYHFGEYVALHYYVSEGWKGTCHYTLSSRKSGRPWIIDGRRMFEASFPPDAVACLQQKRDSTETGKRGKGEPDLFLYHADGRRLCRGEEGWRHGCSATASMFGTGQGNPQRRCRDSLPQGTGAAARTEDD